MIVYVYRFIFSTEFRIAFVLEVETARIHHIPLGAQFFCLYELFGINYAINIASFGAQSCIEWRETTLDAVNAPENFQSLRTLIKQIRAGAAPIRLGVASTRALQHMVDNPASTAVSTMTSIAHNNRVNPSTLTRLAYALGFEKFTDLQALFREYIEENAHFYTHRVNRLISLPRSGSDSDADSVFDRVIREEAENILSLLSTTHQSPLEAIVEKLSTARKVRFYGRRQFYSLAVFYSYCLGLIRERVDIMQDDIHGLSHSLTYMNKSDLLVILGCEPYTKSTVDACRVAHKHDIPFISITDTTASPLTRNALHYLLIPIESHFFSNSMAAAFTQAEALLAMAARKMGQSTLETLKRREKIIEEFGISISNAHDPELL